MTSNFTETHQLALQTGIASLLEENLLTDVSIKVGDVTFECHKLVLSAMSAYFKIMFCGEFKEKNQREITIQNIDSKTFGHVVQYLYGNVDIITERNSENLLKAANILQIDSLQTLCEKYMLDRITLENCFGYWRLARLLSRLNMALMVQEYISKHFDAACQCEEFYLLTSDELVDLIKDDQLETALEENVSEASMRWILNDKIDRMQHLPKIFEQVRLPLTSPEYLVEFTRKYSELFIQGSSFKYLIEAQKYQSLSGQRHEVSSIRTQQRDSSPYANAVVVIGSNGSVVATELTSQFDKQKCSWKLIQILPFKPGILFAACSFMDDIYISGGFSPIKSDFAKLNCKNNECAKLAPLPTPRCRHSMAASGVTLFFIGGSMVNTEFVSSIDAYDVSTQSFEIDVGKLVVAVKSMSTIALNEKLYIFGGKSERAEQTTEIQCFDIRTRQCSVIGNMPSPVTYCCPVCIDNIVYIGFKDGLVAEIDAEDDNSVCVWGCFKPADFSSFTGFQHLGNLYVFENYRSDGNMKRSSSVRIFNLSTKEEIQNDIDSPGCKDRFIAVVKCLVLRKNM